MIGEVLGGYKLVQKLGEGATGETYLAEHQETGQRAAAKVLLASMSADRETLDRCFAEVRASSQVNHVGIADLFDCGVHGNGRAYFVMELLAGKTLTDALIELGQVSDIESFADIGWQLATLLFAVHGSQIVHRALKPDAIFLTFPPTQAPRPLVKLLDFGMGKFSLSVRHSQTGSLLGAPLYMSPEIGRGLPGVDHRADVYSLGCILFEMACGRPPFVREGKGELIIAHATETAPAVASLEPSIPAAIDSLIGRMLTKNPATRPQTMADVASVLEKFFDCPAPGASAALPAAPPRAVPIPAQDTAPAQPRFVTPLRPPSVAASPPVELPPRPVAAAQHQAPTALLPPDTQPGLLPHATPGGMPPAPATWVARVQQRTAILEPPCTRRQPRSDSPAPPRVLPSATTEVMSRRHRHPANPGAAAPGHASASPISLPIVIVTASVLVAVGSSILLLRGRSQPSTASGTTPTVAPAKGHLREEAFHQPPPLQPSLASPPAPDARPASGEESSDRDALPVPTGHRSNPASRPRPGRKGPAPRW
jgi:serine/threonine protein kinase